jgi:hypothetical protein
MTTKRRIQTAALIVFILSGLFPPFHGNAIGINGGFGFFLSWPEYSKLASFVLFTEWVFIAILYWVSVRYFCPTATFFETALTAWVTEKNKQRDLEMEIAHIQANAVITAAEITAKKQPSLFP